MADRARSFRAVARNDLFEEAATGKLYRVVDTGLGEVDTVLCDVRSSRTETFCLPTWELCRRAAPGYAGADRFVEVERKDDPYDAFRKIQCDADGHVWRSKENWRHIASLVEYAVLWATAQSHPGTTRHRIKDKSHDDAQVAPVVSAAGHEPGGDVQQPVPVRSEGPVDQLPGREST
jgi:hypothetical protein